MRVQACELPIRVISTDFDGTLHDDRESPPVPLRLQNLISRLQSQGAAWVINTGRDLPSVLDALALARLSIQPDFLVVAEREIYRRQGTAYTGIDPWNRDCRQAHEMLFAVMKADVPRLTAWVNEHFDATVYEDTFSPFCLLAGNNQEADAIMEHLNDYCRQVPHLTIMRNDVYARFNHDAFNKGTALAEVARLLGVSREQVFAAGDHFNDLPMLSADYARCLVAPDNAVVAVKEAVRRQLGFVSGQPSGHGVAQGLEFFLGQK